jgi:CheY-like chemotaxis protein
VLYIEDEALNVLLMEEVFRSRQDWQLSVARDGEQGLAMAIAEQPDLLLIDLNLPGINGTEVLRRLKRSHPALAERAVMLSANVMPDQINAALAAGFRAYWTKPIHLSALVESIAQILSEGAPGPGELPRIDD